jgi:8-oxo-dGTP pyrophosphatase MutT (NUDIX family)
MTRPLRTAAVLVPLIADGPAPSLVFILRTHHGPHGGQISFPGGVREAADRSAEETALREFEEELGVPRSVVDVIEALPEMLTVTTGYEVTPVIGRIPAGLAWQPDPREVVDVLELPLDALLAPDNRRETLVHYSAWPEPRSFPCVVVDGRTIWGLTFRILERVLPKITAYLASRPK